MRVIVRSPCSRTQFRLARINMWHVDIVCDLDWFEAARGQLGEPVIRARVSNQGDISYGTLLLYGDSLHMRHVRVLLDAESYATVDRCVDENIQYWVTLTEAITAQYCDEATTAARLPGTNTFFSILGEGDESSPSLILTTLPAKERLLDASAIMREISQSSPEHAVHIYYLAKFRNAALPLDVRWLNGYRVIEWHFLRGHVGLAKCKKWHALAGEYTTEIASRLVHGQTIWGFFEQVRATVAHAIVRMPPVDERLRSPVDDALFSFEVLAKIVHRLSPLREDA